ncbi:hypothetical protein [Shinella zoogloeoides]|uniref:hypothetical protein n=1 Tax=Shinella zoogloeoides TaxID=352475 RepID=UPI00299D1AE1|nr:hypothetical protein [Shinella zoogloeoides]WPE24130.1 hypothetical protein ShzoTeo12_53500 [Shinella zoogloeoides]
MEWDAGGREAQIAADTSIKAMVEAIAREVSVINATGLAEVDLASSLRGRLVELRANGLVIVPMMEREFQPKGAPDLGPTFTVQQGLSLDLATDAKARTQALSAAAGNLWNAERSPFRR